MKTLEGNKIRLRALELSDLDFLYQLENDEIVWEVSNTTTPYSKFVLKQYLENAHRDIYEVKQLRLVICEADTDRPLGFTDFYDFEPKHRRAGLGIVVFSEADREKGYASEAISLILKYAFTHLNLHQVYAHISEDNSSSIRLFEKQGFVRSGVKRDWISRGAEFIDELIYQKIQDES